MLQIIGLENTFQWLFTVVSDARVMKTSVPIKSLKGQIVIK